jgi:anaerobic ribonucleoside-triphosphate reductase activating protein
MSEHLRVHHIEEYTSVNGPGLRTAIWLQGCNLRCPGCFNPRTHSLGGGKIYPVDKLFALVQKTSAKVEGITISGGEPLLQAENLFKFIYHVKTIHSLTIILFTGFESDAVWKIPGTTMLKDTIDVIICGPYKSSQRKANCMLGSANKEVIFLSNRYTPEDLNSVPQAEIILQPNGSIILTGIDPLRN